MNGRRDIERVLDAWFVDGPSVMPDRLFDAVFDQVERVPQRRLARLRMRLTEMNPRIRLYSLAAAGLAVAIVGIYLFNRAPISNPGATSSPTATPTAPPATGAVPVVLREIWMGSPRPIPGNAAGAGVALTFDGSSDFWMSQSAGSGRQRVASAAAAAGDERVVLTTTSEGSDCAVGDVGAYTWALSPSGRSLTLTAENDPCALRLASVPGTYWLMDCPTEGDNCLGPVDAGTYSSQFFDPFLAPGGTWNPRFDALGYTVPDGWINVEDWPQFFQLRPSSVAEGTTVILTSNIVISNQAEACSEVQDPTIGTTASEMSSWLSTATGVVASAPQPVTIGGLDGFWLDVSLDPAWTQPCTWSDGKPVRVLLAHPDAADDFAWAIETNHEARLIFLDVPDGRALLILVEARSPADFDAFVDEATPVVESFVFNP